MFTNNLNCEKLDQEGRPQFHDDYLHYQLFIIDSNGECPMLIKLCISESPIEMVLDTGAALSLLSIKTLKSKLGENYYIHLFSGKLKTYSGEIIQPLGTADVHMSYEKQVKLCQP